MFGAIGIAGSGVVTDQTWLDTIGGNLANMNDAVTPGRPVYQVESVLAAPSPPAAGEVAGGVHVEEIALSGRNGQLEYQPDDPLANAQGLVEYPAVDLAQEMVSLVMAQTSYQADASVMSHADSAYQAILAMKG
ncbi:MAG: flagellar basal-body rod protein FlgC [Actinomycetota bacterium]|nr:flagellar basal-body rod protein FlgC [Actinomycetota bacterium]